MRGIVSWAFVLHALAGPAWCGPTAETPALLARGLEAPAVSIPAVSARIDAFLSAPLEAGLRDLSSLAKAEPGAVPSEAAVSARLVLTLVAEPARLSAAMTQMRMPEAFRVRLKKLEKRAAAARKAAAADENLRGTLEQTRAELSGFVTSGRFDDALAGLETLFDAQGARGTAEVLDAEGLGSLVPAVKAGRSLPLLHEGAAERARLAKAVEIIKRHEAVTAVNSGMVAEALDYLRAALRTRRYSPEIKALVLEDAELREALNGLTEGARSKESHAAEIAAAIETIKSRRELPASGREKKLNEALEFLERRAKAVSFEDSVMESIESNYDGTVRQALFEQSSGEPSSYAKRNALAALSVIRRNMAARRGPAVGFADRAADFLHDVLRTQNERKGIKPEVLGELDAIADSKRVQEAHYAASDFAWTRGLMLVFSAISAAVLRIVVVPGHPSFAVAGYAVLVFLVGWAARVRRETRDALHAGARAYLGEYAKHHEVDVLKRKVLEDYRETQARLEGSLAESRSLTAAWNGNAENLPVSLTGEMSFEAGVAVMLDLPGRAHGDALGLLRRMIVIDVWRAHNTRSPEAYEELAEHAALLGKTIPHQAWKDLKPTLAKELRDLLGDEGPENAESLINESLKYLDAYH